MHSTTKILIIILAVLFIGIVYLTAPEVNLNKREDEIVKDGGLYVE